MLLPFGDLMEWLHVPFKKKKKNLAEVEPEWSALEQTSRLDQKLTRLEPT